MKKNWIDIFNLWILSVSKFQYYIDPSETACLNRYYQQLYIWVSILQIIALIMRSPSVAQFNAYSIKYSLCQSERLAIVKSTWLCHILWIAMPSLLWELAGVLSALSKGFFVHPHKLCPEFEGPDGSSKGSKYHLITKYLYPWFDWK